MHTAGRLFPRGDRAPAIEPITHGHLTRLMASDPQMAGWCPARTERVAGGFYISQAIEMVRA
jgi:magnesium-protoporphyrin O-methyltransferase